MNQKVKDTLISIGVFTGAVLICCLLSLLDHNDVYVSMIFILAVFLVSRFTTGYKYGIIMSIISVFAVNFAFTYPYFAFNFILPGYPITIACMFAVSLITSTMTSKLLKQEKFRLESEKETMRSNLLRAVSHDIRTPLTSILGASSTMLENLSVLTEQDQKKLLMGIKEESQWLIRMVENLLSITRMEENGETKLEKTEEALEEVIADAVAKLKKRFPNYPIEINMPEELILVSMDAMLIEQVIINLLENVIYHGKTATKAMIYVESTQDDVKIKIMDDGVGFVKTNSNSINQQDKHRNMGLGLNLCKTIVRVHQGNLELMNREPHGACIQFTLPKTGE